MTSQEEVRSILQIERLSLADFESLLSDSATEIIEELAQKAQRLTQKHFGKTMQFYAPIYLSNECNNQCVYCGFNSKVSGQRVSLSVEQAVAEAKVLAQMGFRHILLVSGEKKDVVSVDYLKRLVFQLRDLFASISIEIYPMSEYDYKELLAAGVDGLTVYQEVYDREIYEKVHPAGPKSDYNFRFETPERGGRAGFYKINIGYLLGLGDWQSETLALAKHAQYLQKKFWQSQISISFPRLKGSRVSDLQLTQMICALRIFLPKVGLVLSTREPAELRDNLIPLGITQMSAASRTSPGAYSQDEPATEQFAISDQRSLTEVAAAIVKKGYEPVYKDWDRVYIETAAIDS
ncbi:thiamine biosynthesis protein ThiH [candidate division WOR-1 bacterium RIFOXYB2_FULL_42_35]|uniref:Thiamine biosynthesis protein ThiH n=1 Tax=candidate division WOR-1 bacterium RIFOXYC2_FULL_41_25 TaxID=1802586 RepID=A0A1F4TJ38_UNCSA|nr:MAG: thiamine biosynthesis protein ThiH [candidate division WOR-1 bacterium RIFOXYA2_FULL_41_14]OGC21871.1 MAG: thiamine biosynthesis protein ThiH [candidate division WOR-1 bacterium RIFOXYB2_FULL_42_35]OGC32735.1 MAG: thiamine biosynthesis protein ThiH [candidate division WOR-1 bacterium RIFOXYC2_FULL_41_25]OGC42531.1 MAG: thiamine biosynthesis protein ThiH [candidate division WOR-1 bacterium RIFOXYD2_FULL_41_8]